MNNRFVAALLSTLAWITTYAQDTIPHVQGQITISVKNGTIACDLTLSNMPRLDDYYLRLNTGMNIRYIKNAEAGTSPMRYETSSQDTLSSGESTAYYLPAYGKNHKYLPHGIRFNYVGMYPVITDTTSAVDWRGNVAFNGTTLRADGIQSAWCPILYDVKTDKAYEKVTYDLDVTCGDCKVIYMNGSEPVSGTHAHLVSSAAQDLTMFVGDYKSVAIDGSYFLNSDADEQQLAELEKILHSYKNYLETKLGITYKGKTVYIQTTPVSKYNSWLFASYPTIVKVGWDDGFKSVTDKQKGASLSQVMAHELSHYYFGSVRKFNSELGAALSEGFAEFLAFNITRTFISDSLYRANLQGKVSSMSNLKPLPIAKIHSENDYQNRELYVYYYVPILLLAIQKEIGEEKMWQWMNALIDSPTVFTNYAFIEQTFRKTVNDEARFTALRDKYFRSDSSFGNALSTLNISADASTHAGVKDTAAETYYYFFFTRPIMDPGSSQNHVIKYTEIRQITCTPSALSAMASPIFKKMQEGCENEAGCTGDFNTYKSMETAQAALKRWLLRYNKGGNMEVKIITP